MYSPAEFIETDKKKIRDLIKQFPLATIVCHLEDDFIVNHIPLLHNEHNDYIGHIAKANPLHSLFPGGVNAVAIFNADESYISPNWYQSEKNVPTWNYQVVHLHGYISFDHSKKSKLSAVGKLTKLYENIHSNNNEWKISNLPKQQVEDMLSEIVALTFNVKKISAKSKLSQNKDKADFDSITRVMDKIGKTNLSKSMKELNIDHTK